MAIRPAPRRPDPVMAEALAVLGLSVTPASRQALAAEVIARHSQALDPRTPPAESAWSWQHAEAYRRLWAALPARATSTPEAAA